MAFVQIDSEDAQPRKKFFGLFRMKGAAKDATAPETAPAGALAASATALGYDQAQGVQPMPYGQPQAQPVAGIPHRDMRVDPSMGVPAAMPAQPGMPVQPGMPPQPGMPVQPRIPVHPGLPPEGAQPAMPQQPGMPGLPPETAMPVQPGMATPPGVPPQPAVPVQEAAPVQQAVPSHQGVPPEMVVPPQPGFPPQPSMQAGLPVQPGMPPEVAVPVQPGMPPGMAVQPGMPAEMAAPSQPGLPPQPGMPPAMSPQMGMSPPMGMPPQPGLPPGLPQQPEMSSPMGLPEQPGIAASSPVVPDGPPGMPVGSPAPMSADHPASLPQADMASPDQPAIHTTTGGATPVAATAAPTPVQQATPMSPDEALAMTSAYMGTGSIDSATTNSAGLDATADTSPTASLSAASSSEEPPTEQTAIAIPPIVVPPEEMSVAADDVATVEGDAPSGLSRGEAIANMAVLAAPDLMSFDTQVTGSADLSTATPTSTPTSPPSTTTPTPASTPSTPSATPNPSSKTSHEPKARPAAEKRQPVKVEVAGDDANIARSADPKRASESVPSTSAIDFLSIEVDLQPIERAIRRNDPVRSIMPRGPERYLPFLVRALAIVGPKFPEMLTTPKLDQLDFLMRVIDDAMPATYPLADVGNRRLSSIAEEIAVRDREASDDSSDDCPVSIATVSRPGPSMGFLADPSTRRVALTLTGVEHRPVATTDHLGCSAMAIHATAFLGASFSHEVSWSRREPFIEELKRTIEGRDWDTEIN